MSSAPVSAVTPTSRLAHEAAYGKLPFDRFVLDNWDYSHLSEENQKQWNELAKKWLSMDHMARSPYWEASQKLTDVALDDSRLPTHEQVSRALAPHQTISERNLALRINDCLWLRTCYDPSLASAYAEMTKFILMDADLAHRVLDNNALYGKLGSDLAKLFFRMPQLPDTSSYCGVPETEDPPLDVEPPEEEYMVPLYNALMKERLILYLLDKEALQKKLLKVCWYDLGGNFVWWNWMSPVDSECFEGHVFGLGHRLNYILELSDSDPSLCKEGALIQFD